MKIYNNIITLLILCCLFVISQSANVQSEDALVTYLSTSNYAQGKAEIVFLLDRSGSVGAADFEVEKGFVESFLTHVVIDGNATRVAVISYSDVAVRHIDYLRDPKNKCFLAQELQDVVYEDSGATNIAAALEEARLVLKNARPGVNKVIVLISDGLATAGGDPVPHASKLKAEGIEIFCFGVGRFLRTELENMASSLQHVYTCSGFREFKRLARKIRGDPHEASWSSQELKPKCDHLCDSPYRGESFDPGCCDPDARCSCSLLSGMHACVCKPGYFGLSGLPGDCRACPIGTYKTKLEPAGSCIPCPAGSTTAEIASTKLSDCYCKDGYAGDPTKDIPCKKISCPPLQTPFKGHILGPCDNIYGSTCHFMCEEGYELADRDSDVRSCKSNGEWTSTTTVCKEITCYPPPIPRNGYIRCEPGPHTVGKRCKFSCGRGYLQEGSVLRECTTSKQWTGTDTKCIPVECGIAPRLTNGHHSCGWHRKTSFGVTCGYRCNYGFSLKGPGFLTCHENGVLLNERGTGEKPECEDVTPPEIICPERIKALTDKGKPFATVTWRVPQPTDNTGYTPKWFSRPPNIVPRQQFPIGNHQVEYIAVDAAGLSSSCIMPITVLDKEPPVVLHCPFKAENSSNEPDARVYWEEPVFQDNSNKPLTIQKNAKSGDLFGQGSRTVTYMAYDSSGNSAVCEFKVIVSRTSCPYYPAPVNGALVCDDLFYGQMCQTYCNERTDFVFKPADWYLCDSSEKWKTIPEDEPVPWPDCSKPSLPGEVKQKVGFYYPGDCNDPRVQAYIKKLFMRNYLEIKSTSICNTRDSCSIKYVDVKCGKVVHNLNRQKRDISDHDEKEHLELEFDIVINSDQEVNDTEAVLQDFLETIRNLNWDFDEELSVSTVPSLQENLVGEETLDSAAQLVVSGEKTTLLCKPGSVLTDELCVMCPTGTYYNGNLQECIDCPVGHFQEMDGQFQCEKCPKGTSTEHSRTRNETACKNFCQPGTHSPTGLETCLACPVGMYQAEVGETSCQECPTGTTTANVASKSVEDCKEVCPPGYFSLNILQPCEPCPKHHYQPLPKQMECLECPTHLSTERQGATKVSDCVDIDPCLVANSCLNNGTCVRQGRKAECQCSAGFEGSRCEKDTDECIQTPCDNNGQCLNTEGSFECICPDGFTGRLCEVETDECISRPCLNRGTCLDKVNGFLCVCPNGFKGTTCEIKMELCFRDVVCLNEGTCIYGDNENTSFCQCSPGFSGIDCSQNINECENVSCSNDGSCIDGSNNFTCACLPGYTGMYCEVDIDECEKNECHNGSTCRDLIGTYKCVCPPGWNGTYCENKMNSDFILVFPESTATIGNMASITLHSNFSDVTVSMWIQTNDTERSGTPLSYAVARVGTNNGDSILDNALTISDCSEVKVYINNKPIVTDMDVADGQWHHLAFTWSSKNSGKWALYKDGQLEHGGQNICPNDVIDGGGSLIVGQEQDTVGGDFSPIETFTGKISRLNIWNRYFSESDITGLYNMDDEIPDKVVAWPDFMKGLRGDVQLLENSRPMMNK